MDAGCPFQPPKFRSNSFRGSQGSLPPENLGKSRGPPHNPAEPPQNPRRDPAEPSERPPQSPPRGKFLVRIQCFSSQCGLHGLCPLDPRVWTTTSPNDHFTVPFAHPQTATPVRCSRLLKCPHGAEKVTCCQRVLLSEPKLLPRKGKSCFSNRVLVKTILEALKWL